MTERQFEELILSIPKADVVEVVRCKDCKYLIDISVLGESLYICGFHSTDKTMYQIYVDDYCSDGERKEK